MRHKVHEINWLYNVCHLSEISDEVADIKDTKDEMFRQIIYDAGAPQPEGLFRFNVFSYFSSFIKQYLIQLF